ncbi:hypothetical protein [Yoonia sp. R2-816]|uniref:hypothetical protein n=1 Tax=Yoonia sp. R2-816 TaxID=3342638 RepID=UPI00372C95A2
MANFLTVKAAIEGQGLAPLKDVFVNEGIVAGQLVRALHTAWPTAFAYYAVSFSEVRDKPSVSTLIKWLKKDLR